MNYCLIHCYSDNNKGDLGIILSTIHLLKEYDPKAVFSAISTYNHDDPAFITEHIILKQYTPVYPSIFGELNIGKKKDAISKMLKLGWDSIRFLLTLLFKNTFFLSNKEKESLKIISEADYVISKGGSFLCNEKDIRTKLANLRFCFLFFVIFRLLPRKKVTILCQSVGPIYGSLSTRLMNFIFKKCDNIVLREKLCLNEYQNIIVPHEKMFFLNDIAFHLPTETLNECVLNRTENRIKVGVTIKTMSPNRNNDYINMMVESLEHLIAKYSADLYIYPHVTIDDDIEASFGVYRKIKDKYKEHIYLFTNNYTSGQLKYLYGHMDFFISSRLHSSIFAMGEGTPAIVIAYHGTKAQGVFANYGLEEWVQQEYSSNELNNRIDNMMLMYNELRSTLNVRVRQDHHSFMTLFNKIFPSEHNEHKNN